MDEEEGGAALARREYGIGFSSKSMSSKSSSFSGAAGEESFAGSGSRPSAPRSLAIW